MAALATDDVVTAEAVDDVVARRARDAVRTGGRALALGQVHGRRQPATALDGRRGIHRGVGEEGDVVEQEPAVGEAGHRRAAGPEEEGVHRAGGGGLTVPVVVLPAGADVGGGAVDGDPHDVVGRAVHEVHLEADGVGCGATEARGHGGRLEAVAVRATARVEGPPVVEEDHPEAVGGVLEADEAHAGAVAPVGADPDAEAGLLGGAGGREVPGGHEGGLAGPTRQPPPWAVVSPASLTVEGEKGWSPKAPLVTAFEKRQDWVPKEAAAMPGVGHHGLVEAGLVTAQPFWPFTEPSA